MKSALKPVAKNVLKMLGLTASASDGDADIPEKFLDWG